MGKRNTTTFTFTTIGPRGGFPILTATYIGRMDDSQRLDTATLHRFGLRDRMKEDETVIAIQYLPDAIAVASRIFNPARGPAPLLIGKFASTLRELIGSLVSGARYKRQPGTVRLVITRHHAHGAPDDTASALFSCASAFPGAELIRLEPWRFEKGPAPA